MAQAVAVGTILTAVIGAGVAIKSAQAQKAAAADAKKIGKQNASLAIAETEEQARRLKYNQSKEQAMTRARAYASGIDPESDTVKLVLAEQKKVNQEELDWLIASGYSRASIFKGEGQTASDVAKAAANQSYGQAATSLLGAVGPTYKAGRQAQWWE